jgi:hypothetical protein
MSDPTISKNASGNNLDISAIDDNDHDQLAACIEGFYKQDSTVKTRLSYGWSRNHMMLDGDQWIVWDGQAETGGIWRRLSVSKGNEYIPRPVTNYLFDDYQTLKSYLIKNKPRSSVRPNSRRYKDKKGAAIAELILECNYEALQEQNNYEYAASCLLVYGTVFKKDYWDPSTITMAHIPKMEQLPDGGQQQAVDPLTGEPQYEDIPLGDVNTDVVEPYRICLDPQATDLHKAKWIMEYSIQTLDWIKETYGKEGDGYTGKVEEVKEERNLTGSLHRFYRLKNSSGMKGWPTAELGSSSGGEENSLTNSAVVKEYYERPSLKHPRGRMVVVAASKVLYAGESPYSGTELGDWHPYSECRWELVPGRFWGKSPLDALTEIQKQINSIDATVILARKTMAVPQRLIPAGSGVAPGQWTGRPGQEIVYRTSDGAKPETIPAAGVDITVFEERKQRREDMKAISGAIDILKGDRPPGVTAASALNLLYEVGTGKLFPIMDRWKKFIENSQKKQLKIIANKYKEPRPAFIARLKAKSDDIFCGWDLDKFIGSDLYDNCNVIVEAGSNIPKLQAAKQAQLMEAAQVGVLALDQPENRAEFNRQMGITGFDYDINPDKERAEWENDLLEDSLLSPDNQPIVLVFDDHAVHKQVLERRMKEPSFLELPHQVQQAFLMHHQQHEQMEQMAQQQQMLETMVTGQPPQQTPSGSNPKPIEGQGKGVSQKMADSLRQDLKIPGEGGNG